MVWENIRLKRQDIDEINMLMRANEKRLDKEKCLWREDLTVGFWETSCDNAFEFTVDGPKENNFRFCPYCGKQVTQTTEGVKS